MRKVCITTVLLHVLITLPLKELGPDYYNRGGGKVDFPPRSVSRCDVNYSPPHPKRAKILKFRPTQKEFQGSTPSELGERAFLRSENRLPYRYQHEAYLPVEGCAVLL